MAPLLQRTRPLTRSQSPRQAPTHLHAWCPACMICQSGHRSGMPCWAQRSRSQAGYQLWLPRSSTPRLHGAQCQFLKQAPLCEAPSSHGRHGHDVACGSSCLQPCLQIALPVQLELLSCAINNHSCAGFGLCLPTAFMQKPQTCLPLYVPALFTCALQTACACAGQTVQRAPSSPRAGCDRSPCTSRACQTCPLTARQHRPHLQASAQTVPDCKNNAWLPETACETTPSTHGACQAHLASRDIQAALRISHTCSRGGEAVHSALRQSQALLSKISRYP